ncbi:MAG TPA: ABC transporter substrate-binding protein [Usitatibacter sp.]|nr:ABC transporter substrate-binding protein [Usitatibacter sp.]
MTRACARAAGFALALVAALPVAAQPLSAAEAAGRRVYIEGTSPAGQEITAEVGMAGAVLPGTAVPCANCHGRDGLGRAEGGVVPPPIVWSQLTQSYGLVHENGRAHPPFDEASAARAITQGLDPAGNRLDSAMPRFHMDPGDLRNLVAYLKRLERDVDPGISDTAIRVGTVLPEGIAAGDAMRKAIESAFDDVNASGGLYGRRLELVVRAHAPRPDAAVEAARALIERDDVLALVSPFALGAEAPLAALAEQKHVPVVGPFTVRGPPGAPGRYTFYLFGGLPEQAEVLVEFALANPAIGGKSVVLVHPDETAARDAAAAVRSRCESRACPPMRVIAYGAPPADAAALAREARETKADAVIFLGGPDDLERFAAAADASGWHPALLAAGTLAGRAAGRLPQAFQGRFFLAYPTAPPRGNTGDAFDRFAAKHRLAAANELPAFSSFVAASLLVDALRRTGREVSREGLVAELEATTAYGSLLAQPIRYGPRRRIGALGGHVVAPAPDGSGFRAVSGWIALD